MSVRLGSSLVLALAACADGSDTLPDCNSRQELTPDAFVGGAVIASGTCWMVQQPLSLNDGTVTVEEGVSIHFATDIPVFVGSGGTLRMAGTEEAPIELGTSDPAIRWQGIQLSDSQGTANDWEHVRIDNAGGDNWNGASFSGAAVYVDGSSTLQMDGVYIRNSASHGLLLRTSDVEVTFANGRFEGNDVPAYVHPGVANAIGAETEFEGNTNAYVSVVYSNTDGVDSDITWAALDLPYRVEDRFYVGSTLTVAAGTVVEMSQGSSMTVRPNAELVMQGTESDPIDIMGADAVAGFWQGIAVEGRITLDQVMISESGSDDWSGRNGSTAALYMNTESAATIRNTTVSNHEGYALWATEDARLDVFENNGVMDGEQTLFLHPDRVGELSGTSVMSGNDDDRIHVVFSNTNRMTVSSSWKDLGLPYFIADRFTVGAPLTLEAGVEWEVAQDVGVTVAAGGSLTTAGSEDNPVVLRGATASANGFWRGFRIDSDESANQLVHTFLEDTGSSTWTGDQESDAALYIADDAMMSLSNVEIGPGGGYGVHLRGDGSLTCSSVIFSSLQDGAIWDDGAGSVLGGC